MEFSELIYPELYILIPVLYLVGIMIKKSSVSDRLIPAFLGLLGIALSCAYILAGSMPQGISDVMSVIFAGSTQGILCASASVYANNIFKQACKKECALSTDEKENEKNEAADTGGNKSD